MSASKNKLLGQFLDAGLFLATLAAVGISIWEEQLPEWSLLIALLVFVGLFVARWWSSQDRNAYLRANWLDLALIVLLASPFLRLLVALKIAGLAPLLRIGILLRQNRERIYKLILISNESLPTALSLLFGVVFLFGLGTYLFEHSHNPSFARIEDGLWWAFSTLTTVGYGDVVPVTSGGRIMAVLTMLLGITVYSLMVANLTNFVQRLSRRKELPPGPDEAER